MLRPRHPLLLLWAAPATLVGLLATAAALAAGARVRRVDGVLEVAGGRLPRWQRRLPRPLRFAAITLGHVVVGTDAATLALLRVHEHEHVRQYERWGVLFFPLYLGAGAWQWLRGRHPHRDNPFERAAFAAEARAQADRQSPAACSDAGPADDDVTRGSCRS